MGRLSALHRLQQVDGEISRRQTRGEQISAILANSNELHSLQQLLDANQDQLGAARVVIREAEYAAEAQQEKLEQTEKSLYGGTVSNPKELQDLQMETESLKRHLQTLEDRLLEVLLEQEELQEQRQSLTEQLAGLQTRQATDHAVLFSEQAQLNIELDNLQAEREAATVSVAAHDLVRYEALSQKLSGLAVATLHEGTCTACGLTITPSMQQVIRGGADLVNCPQCGRILYAG
jgi:predicted  nucleic acid-binding Zn-ribbon protein